MKHSEILQLALDKHLAESASDIGIKTQFICFALAQAVAGLPYQAIANKDEIIEHIVKSMHPAVTVTSWLILNNYINGVPNEIQQDQIQLYRKRWMLHLIEEYKQQGK